MQNSSPAQAPTATPDRPILRKTESQKTKDRRQKERISVISVAAVLRLVISDS
jgi:hypothetical protein